MSRYIDADKLKYTKIIGCYSTEKMAVLEEDIENAPTADVEPVVHAFWKKECRSEITFPNGEVATLIERKCSNCHLWSDKEILNYYPPTPAARCSVCGARMDGKGEK